MKKLLSVLIAALMLMQMFTFTVSAASFSVNWDNGHNGMIEFTRPSKDRIEYTFGIYKDSMYVQGYNVNFSGNYLDVSYYFGPEIEKSGSGSYEIVISYTDANNNLITAKTSSYNYKKPSAKMQKVTGVKFNKSTGVATWNAVPDAYYYEVELMYKDPYEGYYYAPVYGNAYEITSYDFNEYGELDMFYEELEWLAEEYGISANEIETAVRVIAYCEDIETKSSSVSDYYSFSGTVLETNSNETETISEYYWSSRGTVRAPTFKTAENNYYYIVELFKDDKSLAKIPKYEWSPGIFYLSADEAKFIMADSGEGSYQFTVTDSNGNKVTSKKYDYVPGKPLTAPYNLSSNGNIFSWECDDQEVSYYEIELFLTYKDSDYYERVYHDKVYRGTQYETNKWKLEEYNNAVAYNHEKDSVNKNKENARLAFRVYSMPKSTTYTPGASNYFVDGKEIEANKPQEKPLVQVDRSSITDIKYTDGAKIVYDLGFMTNVYENPTANITKGELCEIFTKMLGGELVAESLNRTPAYYKDVGAGTDLNGYIKYIESKQLLVGESESIFGVASEISYVQILKALVSMLGYDSAIVQNYGGYPTGYMVIAAQNNITKGLSIAQDSPVTKEQMALLVFNTMKSKTMKVESYTVNGPVYKQSDESLLFKLGYATIDGIGYADQNILTIDEGTLKDIDNLKGVEVTDLEFENCDYDILAFNGKKATYYVLDGKAMSVLPKFSGSVVINNGDAETSNRNVTLTINADGYTKYKLEGSSAYFPITSTLSYRLAETDGIQYVYLTLANEDETKTLNVSDSIVLNNKHKITYKANGRVFKTVEVGCGKTIPAMTEVPAFSGYRFDGWEAIEYDVMPDKDLVINAKMTPITTVTGKVTVKGTPVEGAKVWINEYWYAQTDANGLFSFDMERGHKMATIKHNNMSKSVFCEFKDASLDLGVITLEAESTEIKVTEESITSVSGAENIFDEEDKEFAKTEGNVVTVKVDVKPAEENTNISQKETETNYKVKTLVDIDITKVKSGAATSETEITETNNLLEFKFVIPAESRGKASYVILREHEGVVDMLTTVPNEAGEYIVINQDVIVVYAKKFSTYALATKEVVSATKTNEGASFEINLNEQVVKDNALMIVKAYNSRGVQLASKTIPVTATYSDTVTLQCEGATGYKLLFFNGLANIKPVYVPINGNL